MTLVNYQKIYEGFESRGFGPFDGSECSMGCCHKDDKHFILFTDGLIIYSNIPYHDQAKYHPDAVVKEWFADEFNFQEFDEILLV